MLSKILLAASVAVLAASDSTMAVNPYRKKRVTAFTADSGIQPLWGYVPGEMEFGSINCFIDGVDVGFHCLMFPRKKFTPADDPLRANRNADLCRDDVNANGVDNDDVHCHASDESALYSHVISDHLNRGYHGVVNCACGSPENFVSDCDITTRNDVDRYDSGSATCNEGWTQRKGPYVWRYRPWGRDYLGDYDKAMLLEVLEYWGIEPNAGTTARRSIDSDSSRRAVVPPVVTKLVDPVDDCVYIEITEYSNGIKSEMQMRETPADRPDCIEIEQNDNVQL